MSAQQNVRNLSSHLVNPTEIPLAKGSKVTCMTDSLNLALIWGSGRPHGQGVHVKDWVLKHIAGPWLVTEFSVAEEALAPSLKVPADRAQRVSAISAALHQSDAFLFVVPEFNHGLPGGVKVFIDHFYSEWKGKTAGMVTYGGQSGGMRAAESIRLIAPELHLNVVRDAVIFPKAREVFSQEAAPHPLLEENIGALHAVLANLEWWARALRDARSARPYPK
jgi:NAD(P)H-dependent FMN reductase